MVSAFAPVNIAWIKYMGKEKGQPTNSSLSMTLEGIGTHTTLTRVSDSPFLEFEWDESGYVPPVSGRAKAELFLKNEGIWTEGFQRLRYSLTFPKGRYLIKTQNNVPAATGIATSASGFAALTLVWIGILMGERLNVWIKDFKENEKTRQEVANLARQGSGSASRSIEGPWVKWDPHHSAYRVKTEGASFADFILLLQEDAKEVSSSEAHERVLTSPLFAGRRKRAEERLEKVTRALLASDYLTLSHEVLEEALDMHQLFHTAQPSFTYLKPESQAWINRVKNRDPGLPTENAILTLDAGANVHLFVPSIESSKWENYIQSVYPHLKFIKAQSGKGARYDEPNF